ncbi:hypothetical protein BSKO_07543 [Bryopsis sp. KO-2023]|nr:hypothetical protein BSKO_07543 [Bryopsis sp. KO-2023]
MGRWNNRGRGRGGGGGRYDGSRRTLKRDFREPRKGSGYKKREWDEIIKESEKFEHYYKAQGLVPEGEWDEFLETLRRPLPVTFRINGRGRFADALKATIDKMCQKPEMGGQENIVPKCLTWYPGGLAYSVLASKKDLRRESSLAEFHELLKMETDDGSMSRQEAVSMIPPLFLDVKPEHDVLDMCASPGSKTFQILEMLHMDPQVPPTGLVVANDLDYQRCNLLTHQIKRMCSPNIMVTSHDATQFPTRKRFEDENVLSFDRVLCDVPCTGDGTLRKSPEIWSQWTVGNGNAMHIQQLRITLKGCQALKVGGRLVYSTCSLNPIEDEAVVAEVIRRTQGAMQLVDVSDKLPLLKRMPGVKTWKVYDPNRYFESYEEAKKVRKEGGFRLVVDETFFPDEESDKMPLERCMRVLPHHQDTGGFFIAVLEKVRELPKFQFPSADHRWEDCDHRPDKFRYRQRREGDRNETAEGGEKAEKDPTEGPSEKEGEKKAEKEAPTEGPKDDSIQDMEAFLKDRPWAFQNGGDYPQIHKGIDPIILLDDHPLVKNVTDFYGIEGFDLGKYLISRMVKDGHARRVYFTCKAVKDLMRKKADHFLRIQAVGQKLLERHEHKHTVLRCVYRFSQEGLPSVLKYITKRILYVNLDDAIRFLVERSLPLPQKPQETGQEKKDSVTPDMSKANDVPKETDQKKDAATSEKPKADGEPLSAATPMEIDQKSKDGNAEKSKEDGGPKSTEAVMETNGKNDEKNDNSAERPEEVNEGSKPDGEQRRPRPILVSDTSLLEQLEDFDDGGAVLMLRDSDAKALGFPLSTEAQGGLTANAPVAVSCWRTRYRINIMMSKPEAMLLASKLEKARAKHFPEAMDVEAAGNVDGDGDGDGSRKRPHENVPASKDSQEREEKSRKVA